MVDYGLERLSRALSVLRLTNFIPKKLTFFLHYLEGTAAKILSIIFEPTYQYNLDSTYSTRRDGPHPQVLLCYPISLSTSLVWRSFESLVVMVVVKEKEMNGR